jgi:hypothetical protein
MFDLLPTLQTPLSDYGSSSVGKQTHNHLLLICLARQSRQVMTWTSSTHDRSSMAWI